MTSDFNLLPGPGCLYTILALALVGAAAAICAAVWVIGHLNVTWG